MAEPLKPSEKKKRAKEQMDARAAAKKARSEAKSKTPEKREPDAPASSQSEDESPRGPTQNIGEGGFGLENKDGEHGLIGVLRDFLRVITSKDSKEGSVMGLEEFLGSFDQDQLTAAANGLSKEEQDKLAPFTPGLFQRNADGTVSVKGVDEKKAAALAGVSDALKNAGKGAEEKTGSGPDTAAELYKAGKIEFPEFQSRLRNFGMDDAAINDVKVLLDDSRAKLITEPTKFDENAIIKFAHNADISHGDAINRLMKLGYTNADAQLILKRGPPAAEQGGDQGGGGSRRGGQVDGGGGRNTVRNTRRYVDIPSNADFLNDFRNGFATHLKGMQASIGPDAASWAIDNMEFFLNDYLGELGKMAQSGQPVYTVPKQGAQPSETSITTTTDTPGKPGGGGGGGAAGDSKDTFTENITEVPRQGNNPVFTLSPAAYLGTKFQGPVIRTLFEGQRGARSASGRTGGTVSPRRV